MPNLIFADGFESGSTSIWTSTAPAGTSGNVFHGIPSTQTTALRVSGLLDGPISVEEAVAFIEGTIVSIVGWDAVRQAFLFWRPGVPALLNTLSVLTPGQAIFITTADPQGLVWRHGLAITEAREVELLAGFNLVGWTGPDGFPIEALQALLGDALVSVFMLNPTTGAFESFIVGAPDFINNLEGLPYSRGVWVQVGQDVTLSMPARDGMLALPAGV